MDLSRFEKRTYQGSKNELIEVRKVNLSRFEKRTYRGLKNRLIEVRKADLSRFEKPTLIILIRVRLRVIRLRTARLTGVRSIRSIHLI